MILIYADPIIANLCYYYYTIMNYHISHPPSIPNLHYRVNTNEILGKGFSSIVYKALNIATN